MARIKILTSKRGVISPWRDLHVAEVAEDIVVQVVHQVTLELQSVFLYRFTLHDKVGLQIGPKSQWKKVCSLGLQCCCC